MIEGILNHLWLKSVKQVTTARLLSLCNRVPNHTPKYRLHPSTAIVIARGSA